MKLCFFAHAQSIHTQKWAQSFVERGHDVHIVTFEDAEIKGATVHTINLPLLLRESSFMFKLAATRILKKLVREIGPDVLHAHYITNYGVFAALTGFHPLVLTAWGSDIQGTANTHLINRAKKSLATYALRKADLITTDAEHMQTKIAAYGVSPHKIRIVGFGVDTSLFKPNGDSPRQPTIISLRLLQRRFNIETLLRAFKIVSEQTSDAKLVVASEGPHRRNLEDLAKNLGLTKQVTFTGHIANEMLPEWLCKSTVYVSSSPSDAGISASTSEAMACELPVVVTDAAENHLWVDREWLFPPYDHKCLAQKILRLLGDAELRRRLGTANRRVIVERNSIQAEMNKMERLYQTLVN